MRFGTRGNFSPDWFNSHRTDVAGAAMLAFAVLFIALVVKRLRD